MKASKTTKTPRITTEMRRIGTLDRILSKQEEVEYEVLGRAYDLSRELMDLGFKHGVSYASSKAFIAGRRAKRAAPKS